MKYKVEVKGTLTTFVQKEYVVEADAKEDAEDIAADEFYEDEFMDCDNLEVEVSSIEKVREDEG